MQSGEVKVAEDSDFKRFIELCVETEGWKQEYNKRNTSVHTKINDVSDFKMFKIKTTYTDVSAEVLYDVLHDPEYRKVWDHSMVEGYEICCINPNNDIGYYSMKCRPFKSRDFVTQRSWLDMGAQYCIINHSVNHQKALPKKGYIRGVSYLTGYLVRKMEGNKCQFTYVSQSDPKGKLPAWAVNKVTQIMAPKVITRIHKACLSYQKWKSTHNPNFKPWLNPEQMTLPRLNMADIKPLSEFNSRESLDDESCMKESDIGENDISDEDSSD
ncbi:START domain-containing protein 10-like [Mytilus galloprovincialis]|uniref:START domain-containing protein 10-like n=1 Tax=Mytilus galloprovincialis TaxID=29158 RepID=UPI003F7B7B0C